MTSHPMIPQHLGWARSAATAALAGVLLSACGGGGGGGGGNPPQPPANVTISGQITFDRIPFDTDPDQGLDPSAIVESPARQVRVQAINGATVVTEGTTDTSGNYSLSVPSNTNVFIRARAEMIKTGAAPTWSFTVRNNANSNAVYAVDGAVASSGTANSTRNLRAPSGFSGNSYTGERAAAPFAILDTVFQAKQIILGAAPSTDFPALGLFWSEDNKPAPGCLSEGNIETTSYIVRGPPPLDRDCGALIEEGIYILGSVDVGGDTDEFDQSVIAHEFGHYFEDRFGRSDSIGGDHGGSATPLDLRVAFGEGWGNAFSSMALGNPIYRDSFNVVDDDFRIDVEADDTLNEGWFSEASVQEILWDLFDPANEPGDTVAIGFTPLFTAMTSTTQTATEALTSIYTFSEALRAAAPASQAALGDLLDDEGIFSTDEFGAGESNNGGDPGIPGILPVYKTIQLNTPISVCSRSPAGDSSTNKLGNRVFLRFDNNAARLVAIQVNGAADGAGTTFATDPDVFVLGQGALVAAGLSTPPGTPPQTTPGAETVDQFLLAAGTFVIEVYDFEMDLVANPQPRCMTVSIQG